ncbi:selenocysteine lyase [Capronia epimyces CBS 606.96]|uniref:Molybdenum cofactor sulfurase n=1 Tax=Capronia epimyces CBS 606.96 TaxID=1182542 RepID=W9XEW3_9EURO|nr:selenocysteine lyase [Capronia epimyces CBS 606.96]EXJ79047.1 selenocysteine lyase [Capronia epimyces CBS 606.96]
MSKDLGKLATLMDTSDATSSEALSCTATTIDPDTGYFVNIDEIRKAEYPVLAETTYLDHAGTTLYAKSLIDAYSKELTSNLFGNPHSASASSQLSSRRIDDVRLQALRFFNANPDEFDIVFVANATAAIKLVGDALRDHDNGFRYHYHGEAHTSLVGLREVAGLGSTCLATDEKVEDWLGSVECGVRGQHGDVSLFAYPAQSNMTGRRLPLQWCRRVNNVRLSSGNPIFTLLDAASLVSTAPLNLSDSVAAPDFVVLSFYKIFGFPDVGALIVRKSSGQILRQRKYFGGGTVDMVTMFGDTWHAKKESRLHSCLEDGTLPFHNIVALQLAFDVHRRLYGTMSNVSRHTTLLASVLRRRLQTLRHGNGLQVCTIYTGDFAAKSSQGPVIAFNIRDMQGRYISNSEVEKLATVKNVQFRTGSLCNPGGMAYHLGLSADEMRRNYIGGQRCGDENDIIGGKPTGAIRLSLGPMSNMTDVEILINFIQEYFVDSSPPPRTLTPQHSVSNCRSGSFVVESLSVFPIKSCAAYKIPSHTPWEVGLKGLAWDREWCLVHEGTNVALSQKRFPRMALIRPEIDLRDRVLRLSFGLGPSTTRQLAIGLDSSPTPRAYHKMCEATTSKWSSVCGEDVDVQVYTSGEVSGFFTEALGVPCTLARFPDNGIVRQAKVRVPGSGGKQATTPGKSIALSNESPILLISRSSVNRLNEQIKHNSGAGKAVSADSFRGNIVIAEELHGGQLEMPYAEEEWSSLQIGNDPAQSFELLGPCQRCQMYIGKDETERWEGLVWYAHVPIVRSCPNISPDKSW